MRHDNFSQPSGEAQNAQFEQGIGQRQKIRSAKTCNCEIGAMLSASVRLCLGQGRGCARCLRVNVWIALWVCVSGLIRTTVCILTCAVSHVNTHTRICWRFAIIFRGFIVLTCTSAKRNKHICSRRANLSAQSIVDNGEDVAQLVSCVEGCVTLARCGDC